MSIVCRLRGKSHGKDGKKAADIIKALKEEVLAERALLAAYKVTVRSVLEEDIKRRNGIVENLPEETAIVAIYSQSLIRYGIRSALNLLAAECGV